MKNKQNICYRLNKYSLLGVMLFVGTSCVDKFLPEEKDAFDRDVTFTRTTFDPVMGHTVFYTGICNVGNSTLPLTFEIVDMMHNDGTPAPELEEFYPVRVWQKPYLGTEKTIEEINAKRGIEYRRLFDVRKHSGEIIMWGEANSGILRCQPDSGYVFNMEITNSGGHKTVKKMRLMPKREMDYEPSIYDSETGLAIAEYVSPETSRMRYQSSGSSFHYSIEPEDIHIYFRENKDKQDGTTSLTISFYDPLPLFAEKTQYTDSKGEKASVKFAASWLSKSGYRQTGFFVFDFAIYKEAHWEMLIHFPKGMPQLGEVKD